MAIIIDTNCFANVFSPKSNKHPEFKPVLEWILVGKGIMVYGGSTYKAELKRTPKYLPIIRLLRDVGKVLEGCQQTIDNIQAEVEDINDDADFDDPHLPAITIATKCKLICSEDTRSIKHVTDRKYYPKGFSAPSYYTSSKNRSLLTDNYVDKSLKPLCKMNKLDSERIKKILK
jgi:hypothetical protein